MAQTCTICRQSEVGTINAQLLQNAPYRDIARQFGVKKDALCRHANKCVVDFLDAGREAAAVKQAVITESSVTEMYSKIKALIDLSDAWLRDPNDPTKYTLDARADNIQVVYYDVTDKDPQTKKAKRKHGDLQELLNRLEKGGLDVDRVKLPKMDYMRTMLEAADRGAKFLELLAKLRGEFTKPKANSISLQEKVDWLVKEHGYTPQAAAQQLKDWGEDSDS